MAVPLLRFPLPAFPSGRVFQLFLLAQHELRLLALEQIPSLLPFVGLSRPIVQMALALDVAVLQTGRPAAKLARD